MIIQNKTNTINPKSIINYQDTRRKVLPNQFTYILNEQPKEEIKYYEYNDIDDLNDNELIEPRKFITQRFKTKSGYSPLIAPSSDFSIEYDTQNLFSDLELKPLIYLSGSDTLVNKFYCNVKGKYKIYANCIITINSPGATVMTLASLKLHKNGAVYDTYCTLPMFVAISISANYHFPVMTFHLDDQIELEVGDYIEIIFNYEQLTGDDFGINPDTLTSILNINLEA